MSVIFAIGSLHQLLCAIAVRFFFPFCTTVLFVAAYSASDLVIVGVDIAFVANVECHRALHLTTLAFINILL